MTMTSLRSLAYWHRRFTNVSAVYYLGCIEYIQEFTADFNIITSVTNMKLVPSFALLLAAVAVLFSAIPGIGALSDAKM
eukprot:scaffold669_cov77-Skeletonema_dohrnii-CCMP3373.AAC.1